MKDGPFLFLDSPRVGDRGHCYVVAQGDTVPAESSLSYLADQARNGRLEGGGVISARHRVRQVTRGMAREGDELLICGGMAPAKPEDAKIVREVLVELLGTLPGGQLHTDAEVSAFLHEARFMTEVAAKFRSDHRIAGINWSAIESVYGDKRWPQQSHPVRPTPRGRLRHLSVFMYLVLLVILVLIRMVFAQIFRPTRPGADSKPPSQPSAEDGASLEKWATFTKDDWPRLMKATGEPDLPNEVARRLDTLRSKSGSKGLSGLRRESVGDEPVSAREDHQTAERMSKWATQFNKEFELPDGGVFKSNPTVDALAKAKGEDGFEAAAWFRDTMDQRKKNYPLQLQNEAKTIENFANVFPQFATPEGKKHPFPADELPSRLRNLVAVLEAFSKSPAVDSDAVKPFRDVLRDALANIDSSPPGYEVLTPKDAGRIDALNRVLGSREFGLIAFHVELQPEGRAWSEIVETVHIAGPAVDKGVTSGARAKLLQELEQVFTVPSKHVEPR